MKESIEIDFIQQLIPGYDLLSPEETEHFETNTNAGLTLCRLFQEYKVSYLYHNDPIYLIGIYFLTMMPSYTPQPLLTIADCKNTFLAEMDNNEDYQALQYRIHLLVLEKHFPQIFSDLSNMEKYELSQTDFAQNFVKEALSSNASAENTSNNIETFHSQFKKWSLYSIVMQSKETAYKKRAETEKDSLVEKFQALSKFIPLLNYRIPGNKKSELKRLRRMTLIQEELLENAELILKDLFLLFLNEAAKVLPFADLKEFNEQTALHQAKLVLIRFTEDKPYPDMLIDCYKEDLYHAILQALQLINGHSWESHKIAVSNQAFSSIYKSILDSTFLGNMTAYMDKLAEAHGFMQATTFVAQNDNALFAILDFWNLSKHKDQISETKSILTGLLKPFMPIYLEYKNIALYEKNALWKIYRSLIPILITVGVIMLCFAALGPAGLPEVALIAALIPAFFIGLALTTLYIQLKDTIYHSLRCSIYGGPYAIPEYQVSTSMLAAFQSPKLAQDIRDYYVARLQACDAVEQALQIKPALTQNEKTEQEENRKQRELIYLEWYDIHSNNHIASDKVPTVVLARLQKDGDLIYNDLIQSLEDNKPSVRTAVDKLGDKLGDELEAHTPLTTTNAQKKPPLIKINFDASFFPRPNSLAHQKRLAAIDNLMHQLPIPLGSIN